MQVKCDRCKKPYELKKPRARDINDEIIAEQDKIKSRLSKEKRETIERVMQDNLN